MSKEAKKGSATEEPVTMQVSGVPVEELELGSIGLATEFITDLKKQLEETKEEAKGWEENWRFVLDQREILKKKLDIINFVLKFHDYRCLEMAQNFVRTAYNQQPPEEDEQEGDE